MTEILTADNLATLSSIRHAFFTKTWGNAGFSGQENPDDVYVNREKMASYLHVASQNLLSAYQIHSPTVVTVTHNWSAAERPEADALVTNNPDFAIGVLTADCVPVLFADTKAGVIGAAHAGWRGAVTGVLDNTVEAMEKLGASKSSIRAALGPCIWQNSYEVGPEFPAVFLAEDPTHQRFFRPSLKSGHYMFDLPAYIMARLYKLGLSSVASSPADTCAEPERFFSHRYSTLRNEKRGGNLMSAIALS